MDVIDVLTTERRVIMMYAVVSQLETLNERQSQSRGNRFRCLKSRGGCMFRVT